MAYLQIGATQRSGIRLSVKPLPTVDGRARCVRSRGDRRSIASVRSRLSAAGAEVRPMRTIVAQADSPVPLAAQ